jgi:hypothetical protein
MPLLKRRSNDDEFDDVDDYNDNDNNDVHIDKDKNIYDHDKHCLLYAFRSRAMPILKRGNSYTKFDDDNDNNDNNSYDHINNSNIYCVYIGGKLCLY